MRLRARFALQETRPFADDNGRFSMKRLPLLSLLALALPSLLSAETTTLRAAPTRPAAATLPASTPAATPSAATTSPTAPVKGKKTHHARKHRAKKHRKKHAK